jgi:hypothetical protein
MAEAPFSATAPPGEVCPDGASPKRWFVEPKQEPPQCKPCSCGALSGGSCTAQLLCAENSSCQGVSNYSKSDGSCDGSVSTTALSCQLGPPSITAIGTCAPAGGEIVDAEMWKKLADICDTQPNGSCSPTDECLPRGTGAYAGFICVYSPGEVATCPGDYSIRSVVYLAGIDERMCSACTCTPPATPSCSGPVYEFFDDGFCGVGGKSVGSQNCTDVSGAIAGFLPGWGYRKQSNPTVQGSCAVSGGSPSGTVVGDDDSSLTVCCRYQG